MSSLGCGYKSIEHDGQRHYKSISAGTSATSLLIINILKTFDVNNIHAKYTREKNNNKLKLKRFKILLQTWSCNSLVLVILRQKTWTCMFFGPENNTSLVYLKTENIIIWLFDKLRETKKKGYLNSTFYMYHIFESQGSYWMTSYLRFHPFIGCCYCQYLTA